MFIKSDPLGGLSEDKHLDFVEDYLSNSTEEASRLARKTGQLIKTALTGQEFHSTAINEITNNVGSSRRTSLKNLIVPLFGPLQKH